MVLGLHRKCKVYIDSQRVLGCVVLGGSLLWDWEGLWNEVGRKYIPSNTNAGHFDNQGVKRHDNSILRQQLFQLIN